MEERKPLSSLSQPEHGLQTLRRKSSQSGLNGATISFLERSQVANSTLGLDLQHILDELERHGGGIWSLKENVGSTPNNLLAWESNHGVKLPSGLSKVLTKSNGVVARWAIPMRGCTRDIGIITLNSLEKIAQAEVPYLSHKTGFVETSRKGFVLSNVGGIGTTCLVYEASNCREDEPQVWFKDLAGTWHFLAQCFDNYMRLVFVHFGIRGWENSFTPSGMDPEALQWLRLLSPLRVHIDQLRAIFPTAIPCEIEKLGEKAVVSLSYLDNPVAQDKTEKRRRPSTASRGSRPSSASFGQRK